MYVRCILNYILFYIATCMRSLVDTHFYLKLFQTETIVVALLNSDIYNFNFLDSTQLLFAVNKCYPIFHCLQLQ